VVTGPADLSDQRVRDLHLAWTLSLFSVVWGLFAAIVAIILGVASGSLSVIGFGVDSAIDSGASVALAWRFHVERQDPARAARVEHLAERIVGGVLVVAAGALAIGATRALLVHDEVHPQPGQLVLLVASLAVLPPLAFAKRRVADRLTSRALRNDALLTAAAAVLALIALLAGGLAVSLGLWWADAVGSLVIAAVLAREGLVSIQEAGRSGS